MPHTQSGKYYKLVNGKRQYNGKYDKKPDAGEYKSYKKQNKKTEYSQKSKMVKPALEFGGSMLGSAIGALVGPEGIPIGAMIGQQAGASIASIGGYGQYKIKRNTLMQQKPPAMVNTDTRGGSVIQMREYLGDIVSHATPNTFKIDKFPINVGLADTFPLGSEISRNYQKYQLLGCVFEFRSMSGNALNSVNTALGQVVSCIDTTCIANYSSKILVEDTDGGQSCKPSESMLIPVECARDLVLGNVAYVRASNVPVGQDVKTFDYGNLIIGSNGIQGSSVNLGELWVTYQVKLIAPRLFDNLGLSIGYYNLVNFSYNNSNPLGIASGTKWLSTGNNLGVVITPTAITFPKTLIPRRFIITVDWIANNNIGNNSYPSRTYANLNTLPIFVDSANGATSEQNFPIDGVPGFQMLLRMAIETINNGTQATITLGTGGALPSAPIRVEIFIIEIPSNSAFPSLLSTLTSLDQHTTSEVSSQKTPSICPAEFSDCECDKSIEDDKEIPDFVKRYLARKGVSL